jgi:hypothetical protein
VLQLADAIVAGTVDGKDVAPVRFVDHVAPKDAAHEVFEIQSRPTRETIRELHGGLLAHRP